MQAGVQKFPNQKFLEQVDWKTQFELISKNTPCGDQPAAIDALTQNIATQRLGTLSAKGKSQSRHVLLGITGSGKTFTIANVIQKLQRPTLVLAHNKTLAAQLYSEFLELFPKNAVRYFVSYYDYYQPEAYVPSTDTYIEKDAAINDEIDKLRHAATKALLERRDVIIVSSVSCIYGLGEPEVYFESVLFLERGSKITKEKVLRKLVDLQYTREETEPTAGTFRARGDVVEVIPVAEDELALRLEFFGEELEAISEIDRISGTARARLERACIYPASHFVTSRENVDRALKTIRSELEACIPELDGLGKTLESKRLEQRVRYDLELLEEMGFCPGIENYSRHLTGRLPGEPPPTLVDYFPEDLLVVIDESHVTVPQLLGMYRGDRSRKQTLVDYGFRLPSALDNRPLRFDEFLERTKDIIFVSATPAKYELEQAQCSDISPGNVVEQIIRPTGLIDPVVEIRPAQNQVIDFQAEIAQVIARRERVLVTTLTKRLAEDLSEYYREQGLKVRYLHSDIEVLERIELIRSLRNGDYDILVGINLLREGLDLPEVSLVGIMDADKEGFLRSSTSLIQTIGRAARNLNGRVILYADKQTDSIKYAVRETERRRKMQIEYNSVHQIIPRSVTRAQEAQFISREEIFAEIDVKELPKTQRECQLLLEKYRKEMFALAKRLRFEQAAALRDKVKVLERLFYSLS
ncbi:excinuclease ABC subunit UvrB [bacterium]|nr:excinuclease ABC subunit UvrB [bacterium]